MRGGRGWSSASPRLSPGWRLLPVDTRPLITTSNVGNLQQGASVTPYPLLPRRLISIYKGYIHPVMAEARDTRRFPLTRWRTSGWASGLARMSHTTQVYAYTRQKMSYWCIGLDISFVCRYLYIVRAALIIGSTCVYVCIGFVYFEGLGNESNEKQRWTREPLSCEITMGPSSSGIVWHCPGRNFKIGSCDIAPEVSVIALCYSNIWFSD